MTTFIAEQFYWVFLVILLVNVMQRRHQKQAGRKRFATLYLAIAAFALMVAAQTIIATGVDEWWLAPVVVAVGGVLYVYREHTFPFRSTSRKDGRQLTWKEIVYYDDE